MACIRVAICSLLIASTINTGSVSAQIVESASTLAVVNTIKSTIQTTIDQAANRADYLTFRAGTEMRNTIDSWEKANEKLLDEAFAKLSVTQQNFLREIDAQRSKLSSDASKAAEVATQVGELWTQSINDAKFWQGEVAFYRISSPIIAPTGSSFVNFILRGINIDNANPQLKFLDGQKAERTFLAKQETHFTVKRDAFAFAENEVVVKKAVLVLTQPGTFFKKPQRREFDVSFMLLPKNLGRFEVNAITEIVKREPTTKEREFGYSSNDGCEIQNQGPSNDFKLNTDSIKPYARPNPNAGKERDLGFIKVKEPATFPAEWGRGGSWQVESVSPQGFSVKLCAKRWFGPGLDSGPGNQHVYLRWEEYKEVKESLAVPVIVLPAQGAGALKWNEDVALLVPANSTGVAIRFVDFQGRVTEAASSYSDPKAFAQIEWNAGTRQLIIRPKVPADIAGL